MYYYEVSLNIDIAKTFYYYSNSELKVGVRVIIPFGNMLKSGFVIKKVPEKMLSKNIKYKSVIEVLEEEPKISEELLDLSNWISAYYFCSLGRAITSMLPAVLNIEIMQTITILDNIVISNPLSKFLSSLPKDQKYKVKDILRTSKLSGIFKQLTELEQVGHISIERKFTQKMKTKKSLYVSFLGVGDSALTVKQLEIVEYFQDNADKQLFKDVCNMYSVSRINNLVSKGILKKEFITVDNLFKQKFNKISNKEIILTDEQTNSIIAITECLGQFKPFLLHGITGSGKTEVYIRVMGKVLEKKQTCLVLIPEIALTPQTAARFYQAFGEQISILHSGLSDRARYEEWNRIKSGSSKLVVGVRSAIFAPLSNIGLVIVDEEHDNSYKQDNSPRYNARDLAIVRAKYNSCPIILGSATPSLESIQNTKTGKYELLKLTKRPTSATLPRVTLIDMRKEPKQDLLSKYLVNRISDKLRVNEQIMILHNRRGFSSFVQCRSCGEIVQCRHCDISMHFHKDSNELICHYCGTTSSVPRKCNNCGGFEFKLGTPGTQKIEEILNERFPEANILRLDSDTAKKKDAHSLVFDSMHQGDVDILLGTQMIAKGLDFPNVTLACVISADLSLSFPDFRAAEKTFQLLTQISGRAGRAEKKGEVVIQTYNPEHYAISYAADNQADVFYKEELALRKALKYPPHFKLARIIYLHSNEKLLTNSLDRMQPFIQSLMREFNGSVQILGPVPAPIGKINKMYRFHLLVKAENITFLQQSVSALRVYQLPPSVLVKIDIDPYNML
ncbi:MAG: primosomal protein N' [Candidatus Zophobacter franzmannii]|nr:primosomal protein N' [Candidatus Zophobacter franzmannii]